MIDLGRPFRTGYHPARAWLLTRGVLGLLAFDAWLEMLEHAGRYGIGRFNVAHFAWIDAVSPQVTPALYGGMVLTSGLLALLMTLTRAPQLGKALLALVYTSSWLISLHDSYQHHYLLSWLLLWLVFVPDPPRETTTAPAAVPVRGVGLPMAALTCAIVYAFTGVAKSEPAWRSGAVLRRLSHSREPGDPEPGVLDPLRDALLALGLDTAQAWALIAGSVIALQVAVALGYLASLERDERPGRLRSVFTFLGLACACSFHAFAELGEMFQIGWFSFYMLWVAFVLLAPAPWLAFVAREIAWPLGALRARLTWLDGPTSSPRAAMLLLGAAALALCAAGFWLDLPGARGAVLVAQLFVLGFGAAWIAQQRTHQARALGVSGLLTALAFWLAMTQTSVRFDYYRRTAGELQRMGLLQEALADYRKAQRYAPPGASRKGKIEQLEAELDTANAPR